MAYEMTVSDKLSSWGFGGKTFKPGIYIITRDDIAAAARQQDNVSVREVDEDEARLVSQFTSDIQSGPLTTQDFRDALKDARRVGPDYICVVKGCTSPPYKTEQALRAHQAQAHAPGEAEKEEAEVAEAAATAEAEAKAAQEADENTLVEESTDVFTTGDLGKADA